MANLENIIYHLEQIVIELKNKPKDISMISISEDDEKLLLEKYIPIFKNLSSIEQEDLLANLLENNEIKIEEALYLGEYFNLNKD